MDEPLTSQIEPEAPAKKSRRFGTPLLFMGAGIASLIAAGLLFTFTILGVWDNDRGGSGPETVTGFGPGIDYFLNPEPTPTSGDQEPTPINESPITSISIPRFEIDAPVLIMGVDENGIMEAPDGPDDAAWYDFSAYPGAGSNAVFSGHVDWYNTGPDGGPGEAVFWHLKDLDQGDLIEVRLEDGTLYTYQVASREQVDPKTADVGAIVGPTQQELLTLITCGGTFDPDTRSYNMRVVVRAERVVESASR